MVFCLSEDVMVLKKFFSPKKGGRLSELWNRNKGPRNSTIN